MKKSDNLKDELKKKQANKLRESLNDKDSITKNDDLKDKALVIEEIIDEKKAEFEEENKKIEKIKEVKTPSKEKKLHKGLVIFFVLLGTLSFIGYLIYQILTTESIINVLPNLIGSGIIALFILCFMVTSLKNNNHRATPFIILGSLLLIGYSAFNILYSYNFINLPKENAVLNFYNQTITYATKWGKENNIDIEEIYEFSDIIPEYSIIAQDVSVGTLTREISKITFIISKGPDYSKETIVPSFIGWNFDEVIKYLEDNYLNNVAIEFIASNNKENTVISQDGSGTMKRNDLIKLQFAQGTIEETEIIDFTNKSLLYSSSWLKMKGFEYDVIYEYNENIKKDFVINQNVKNEVKDPLKDTIILTISKGKSIVIPNINAMSQDELNAWVIENGLKINYNEVYDEESAYGDIIDVNYEEGKVIETGDTINVTISKGRLEMLSITSLTDFYLWADQNSVSYQVEYEFSDSVKKDDIIKTSHKTGEIIKRNDTVIIYVSKGKSITIPNFVGMSKTSISNKCNELNLSCSFTYGGYTESIKKDIATKQSKNNGSTVAEGTNLVITLSSGIYEKVSIPNFVGKTKSEITTTCKSIGLNCTFTYESNYSSTTKDIATKQSKTGSVNKGTSITLTLSKGPAQTYNVVIQGEDLTGGNPEATKKALQSKLSAACPGVNFTYSYEKVNTGIGYLAQNSEVKIGSNTFVQGKTYKVIINSN